MRSILFIFSFIFCISVAVKAQDKIYRQNGKVIEAKIIEVGSSEIKYKEYKNPDGPIYILETDRIKKIVYENGKEEKFIDNLKDPERYAGQANKALKLNFLSPLYGYAEVGIEKNVSPGKSFELSLGVIGAGKSGTLGYYNGQFEEVKRKPAGFFMSGGYKFGKLPDFIIFGKTKSSHLMQGTYIKPVIYFGHYSETQMQEKSSNVFEKGKQQVTFGALQLELGRQWVMGEKLLLDIYWGVGYGFDNKKSSVKYLDNNYYFEDDAAFNYVNARGGNSPGISGTWGIKLGWLLNDKKKD
jgi:hypothetical protein